jgi:hypothetical protein
MTYKGPNGEPLSTTPRPGSRKVTVSRSVPVTMIAGADGTQAVAVDTEDPCYSCKCCAIWAHGLAQLRAAMIEHEEGQHGMFDQDGSKSGEPRLPGCLVCQVLVGAADEPTP